MDQKNVALQLRKLASDPDNQTYIVKEKGCMKGLLGFLDSGEPEVVLISLQALQFLSAHPANKEGLAKHPGLLGKLAVLSDHDHTQVAAVSTAVLANLADFVSGSSRAATASAARREERKEPAFKPKYLFNITLELPTMVTKAAADKAEAALLAVKGVISVTVDLPARTATVYTRVQEDVIRPNMVTAVRRAGLVPAGEESRAAAAAAAACGGENAGAAGNAAPAARPAYPSFGGKAGAAAAGAAGRPSYLAPSARRAQRKGALVEYSSLQQSTLEARMQKQQQKKMEEQKKKSTVRSLFGAVTGYFW